MIDKALHFSSKPSTGIDSEFADLSTTIGKTSEGENDSPTMKGNGLSLKNRKDYETLTEVAEFPNSTFKNEFKNNRMLKKGCHKLLKMAG
jgi:hypothetical protein